MQRAYKDIHGKLPIEEGVDVINARGLSFMRYLDIARRLKRETAVVTDNDGNPPSDVEAKYIDYTTETYLTVHVGKDETIPTLEPQLLAVNSRAILNAILGTSYETDDLLLNYMRNNKTTCGLAIFESNTSIVIPQYIRDAVA